jgi:hypothetical protein
MDAASPERPEDRFDELLAAYDEALAAGRPPPAVPDEALPPELLENLRGSQMILQALEQLHLRTGKKPKANGISLRRGVASAIPARPG